MRAPVDRMMLGEARALAQRLINENERLLARVRELEAQWEEHCAYHGSESPHALNDALNRCTDAESACRALSEDRTALRERMAKAVEILSNYGVGTWYAVPALEALRGP